LKEIRSHPNCESNYVLCSLLAPESNLRVAEEASDLMGQNVNIIMREPHAHLHDSYFSSYVVTGTKKVLGIGRKLRGRRCAVYI
jgi:hypothetical protein